MKIFLSMVSLCSEPTSEIHPVLVYMELRYVDGLLNLFNCCLSITPWWHLYRSLPLNDVGQWRPQLFYNQECMSVDRGSQKISMSAPGVYFNLYSIFTSMPNSIGLLLWLDMKLSKPPPPICGPCSSSRDCMWPMHAAGAETACRPSISRSFSSLPLVSCINYLHRCQSTNIYNTITTHLFLTVINLLNI